MKMPPEYARRVQLCIRCPFGSSRAACTVDGKQYHDHALSGECPKSVYGMGLPQPIEPEHRPTPTHATKGRCCS